ncbi:MAG: GldM family protein [Lewinella sp.]
MKKTTLMLLLLVVCVWSCDHLPLTDERVRPEPPALPAEIITGDPFVNLTASKMNVVYVGVSNPLDLQATGVNLNDLQVMASPPGYITEYEKAYSLKVSTPGVQMVRVLHKGKLLKTFNFRVKRIPDPVAKLSGKSSGRIRLAEFKAQLGLIAYLDDFDFNRKCVVTGFKITRHSLTEGRQEETNIDGRFEPASKKMIVMAAPKDIYTFTNVRAKCPGENVSRTINSLVFEII